MFEEVEDLPSHIASAKSTNALFGTNQNFNTHGKLMTIQPKGLARHALCFIPNWRRTYTRPKS
jgi:hypothetical protein